MANEILYPVRLKEAVMPDKTLCANHTTCAEIQCPRHPAHYRYLDYSTECSRADFEGTDECLKEA